MDALTSGTRVFAVLATVVGGFVSHWATRTGFDGEKARTTNTRSSRANSPFGKERWTLKWGT